MRLTWTERAELQRFERNESLEAHFNTKSHGTCDPYPSPPPAGGTKGGQLPAATIAGMVRLCALARRDHPGLISFLSKILSKEVN